MTTRATKSSVEGVGSTEFGRRSDVTLQSNIACASTEAKCVLAALLAQGGARDINDLNELIEDIVDRSSVPLWHTPAPSYFSEVCKQLVRATMVTQHKGNRSKREWHSYSLSHRGHVQFVPFAGNLVTQISLAHPISLYTLWKEPRLPLPREITGTVGRLSLMRELVDTPLHLGPDAGSKVKAGGVSLGTRKAWITDMTTHPFMEVVDERLQARAEYAPVILDVAAFLDAARNPSNRFIQRGCDAVQALEEQPKVVVELLNRTFEHSQKVPGAKAIYSELAPDLVQAIRDEGGVMTATQLDTRLPELFPHLSPDQLERLSSKIRRGKVPGFRAIKDDGETFILVKPALGTT